MLFQTILLYIKFSKNSIEIINLKTGEHFKKNAINKFSIDRTIIANFQNAEELLQGLFNTILPKKHHFFLRIKAVVQQIEPIEGGVTQVEKRAYLDICEQVGCMELHFMEGVKELTQVEALQQFIKRK